MIKLTANSPQFNTGVTVPITNVNATASNPNAANASFDEVIQGLGVRIGKETQMLPASNG